MSEPLAPHGSTSSALELLARPLRYVSRHGFANLSRVRNLEGTLRALIPRSWNRGNQGNVTGAKVIDVAGVRETEETSETAETDETAEFERLIDGIDALLPEARVERIRVLLDRVERALKGRASSAGSGSAPGPDSAAGPDSASEGRSVARRSLPRGRGARGSARSTPKRVRPKDAWPTTVLSNVVGVGPKSAERLAAKGLVTVEDALLFLPRRYVAWEGMSTIASLSDGMSATIRGRVRAVRIRPVGRGRRVLEVVVGDDTGSLTCRFFRFHRAAAERYSVGLEVQASGTARRTRIGLYMVHPEMKSSLGEESADVRHGAVPVYGEIEGVHPRSLRKIIGELADAVAPRLLDPLPEELRARCGLLELGEAILSAHRPRPKAKDISYAPDSMGAPPSVQAGPSIHPENLLPPEGPGQREALPECEDAQQGEDVHQREEPPQPEGPPQREHPTQGEGRPRCEDPPRRDETGPAECALHRLVFDELFYLLLVVELERRRRTRAVGVVNRSERPWRTLAVRAFPFPMTGEQASVLDVLEEELAVERPMNRLLQGDVGCGKTAVALIAAALVREAGRQSILVTPTEVLARQHHATAARALAELKVRVALLTGSTGRRERAVLLSSLARGEVDLLIGTHAILEPDVELRDLGFVVIDEQHRFGVEQRNALRRRRRDGRTPDVLVMTATPIPRSLALTVYGDLDLSLIRELPAGRAGVITSVVTRDRIETVHSAVRRELERGRQAYFVYPLVEESEVGDLAAAASAVEDLAKRFADWRVGLLHGRMRPAEKAEVMCAYQRGEVDVLVSTTVIEVGIDVPNATVMVVEGAERFGLSQLHQLRGRVGRGVSPGQCFLVPTSDRTDFVDRLRLLETAADGFEIAEHDFFLRGTGELSGTRQSGAGELVLANLVRDAAIVELAKEEARALLDRDEALGSQETQAIVREMLRRHPRGTALAGVG